MNTITVETYKTIDGRPDFSRFEVRRGDQTLGLVVSFSDGSWLSQMTGRSESLSHNSLEAAIEFIANQSL